MNLDEGMDYGQLSEAVRHFSAERLYSLVNMLEPHMQNLFDRDPNALGYMEPVRIAAQVQVLKAYVASVKELGALYRVAQQPLVPEPEEPMVPAAQVPLMIAAAVENAVIETAERVKAELAEQAAVKARVSEDEARAALGQALVRIRGRAV